MRDSKTYQELDERIIHSILLIAAFAATIYAFYDFLLAYYWSGLMDILVLSIALCSYYLIKYKNAYNYIAIPTIFIIFGLCVADFFFKYGFYGSANINFLIIGFVIALVFYGRTRNVMLVVYFLVTATLAYIQFFIPTLIPNVYEKQNVWGIFFYFVVYTALLVYLAIIIRQEYKKEKTENIKQKKLLEKQGREISEKNQEILAQQEEITSFNEHLEVLVDKREAELDYKNRQLENYIHFNTVKVTSPLQELSAFASIVSRQLAEEKLGDTQAEIEMITKLAIELDNITKEINQILSPDHE